LKGEQLYTLLIPRFLFPIA